MNTPNARRKILFVGSFKQPRDGKIGGQYFACSSLMGSSLKDQFEFITIDSTLDSIHVGSVFFRLNKIVARIIRYLYHLVFSRVKVAFIFSSSGLSFIEKGFMCIMARIAGKRVVLFPRSGNLLNDAKKKWYHIYLKLVFRSCNIVICQSEFWKDSFSALVPKLPANRFVVLENWLNDDYFEYFSGTKLVPPEAEKLRILYFNRIEVDKGIYEFVEAIQELRSRGVPLVAHIFGDGREIEGIKRYLAEKKNSDVSFLGWLKNKKEIIPSYDVYVFASHSEGFPNALLEVMALGVAVISTNVGAVPDLIKQGENGYIVPVKNAFLIADAVQKIDRNRHLIRQFAERSYLRVKSNNRLSVAVDRLQKILDTV
jgi:glycosyltransferase involved in cell wall biosynthesis